MLNKNKLILVVLTTILVSQSVVAGNLGRRITTNTELDNEIRTLVKNYDPEQPDMLIKLFDYANRNAADKGLILNMLALSPKNKKESDNALLISNFIDDRIITLKNKDIPKNGEWSYQAGHSKFMPNTHSKTNSIQEIRDAIGPYGVPFEYGYPNFKEYRVGELIKFDYMVGSYQQDYDKALEQIPFKKIKVNGYYFETPQEFREYMQSVHANLHYSLYEQGFELIPDAVYNIIDYEIPYIDKRIKDNSYLLKH